MGAVSIKLILNNTQYKFIENTQYVELYDAKTNIRVSIDIYTAIELYKEELQYKIMLDNSQSILIKVL